MAKRKGTKRKGKMRFVFYLPTPDGAGAKEAAKLAGQTVSEWMRRLVEAAKKGSANGEP
jgi:hypothetical protein